MSAHPPVIEGIEELRAYLAEARRAGRVIGLVPTMGALHAGHGRLIEEARRGSDVVVVSVFVNPIQFNQREDFERYPRDLHADAAFCGRLGADVIFAPTEAGMYPEAPLAYVDVERLTGHLCGAWRPGHFRGVATVVSKLFHIVEPRRAWFGEKDAQQLAVIRRMVRDLNMPVEIVGVPIVREPDGLAMSSRNQRLSAAERAVAPAIYAALCAGAARARAGGAGVAEVLDAARQVMAKYPELRIEYLELVDPLEMQPVERVTPPLLLATAVWLGPVRLIDNVAV